MTTRLTQVVGSTVFLCAACGGTPTTPSPEPVPNPPAGYSTAGRLVNVLEVGRGVEGAIVLEGSTAIATDANGFFTVPSETSGAFRVTISAPGYAISTDVTWFDRQAGCLLYQRPPAHRIPDIDPRGFLVNSAAASLGFVLPRGSVSAPASTRICPGPPSRL